MKTNLELLVLGLVQQGLGSPYELNTRAGLSIGSTVPVLSRLLKDGLLKTSEEGSRRSRKFSITAKGARLLAHECSGQLRINQTDVDAIIRLAYLTLLQGDAKATQEFLKRSAKGLRRWAINRRAEADRISATTEKHPESATLIWMRTHYEAARAEADASALEDLSTQIGKKSDKTSKRSRRS